MGWKISALGGAKLLPAISFNTSIFHSHYRVQSSGLWGHTTYSCRMRGMGLGPTVQQAVHVGSKHPQTGSNPTAGTRVTGKTAPSLGKH